MTLEVKQNRIFGIRGFIASVRVKAARLGEIVKIKTPQGDKLAMVISIDHDTAKLQIFGSTNGISTNSEIVFLGKMFESCTSNDMFGRVFNGLGQPIDGGHEIIGKKSSIQLVSYNPESRVVPRDMVRTNIPMIDVFNCLVRSQKIPIFCDSGDKYNDLLIRIAKNTDADAIVIGGMFLTYEMQEKFMNFMDEKDVADKSVAFIHRAEDPTAEAIMIPDMAISFASKLATIGKNVIVLLTDMTAFADALKEVAITLDQLPSNRGYPGSLYSDLAYRYEQAIDIEGAGSVTILSVTTMPGNDITHPVPDNTGYITEGQICLSGNSIDPFKSLSRLKQLVIGVKTRRDHGELANAMIQMYAESRKSVEKEMMGFQLTDRDIRYIKYGESFEKNMMNLDIVRSLENSLNLGWSMLKQFFSEEEIGINPSILKEFWPKS